MQREVYSEGSASSEYDVSESGSYYDEESYDSESDNEANNAQQNNALSQERVEGDNSGDN